MFLGRRRTVAFATLAMAALAACSDSAGVEEAQQDFTGSYTLVSFSQGTADFVTEVPGSTGTFTMTASSYQASIHLLVPVDMTIVDEGTYTAVGAETTGTWSQQSTVDQNLQYAGTYLYDPEIGRAHV